MLSSAAVGALALAALLAVTTAQEQGNYMAESTAITARSAPCKAQKAEDGCIATKDCEWKGNTRTGNERTECDLNGLVVAEMMAASPAINAAMQKSIECSTKGKSGEAACVAVKDCEWKMNQQGQMSCAVSAAYTRNLVFSAIGGGDACKGMNAMLDTAGKCMGMAKDACPSSDCEWKEKDSECNPPSTFMATAMADKDMGEFFKKTNAVAEPCGGAQTSAACTAAGDVCEWATDFGKESLAEKCDAAPLPIISTLGCGGGLNKRYLALMAKGKRADAAKVQERATAATAKVAEVKAKLTACSNCTTVELTSIQAEVKDAESQEAKLVKAVSESKTAAEAAEQTAADSTARALASCAAAVLASLLAGLMAF